MTVNAAKQTQRTVQQTRADAVAWAKGLKLKDAAADLAILPLFAPAYLLGLLWYSFRYLLGIVIVGFRKGARMS
jgi:hypothetical protein